MHGVVIESLEEYLAGSLEPAAQRDIEVHLSNCEMCRKEIRAMREVSQWFGALRSEEVWDPAPAFCARVMEQVSLLTLAILGSYLVSRETRYPSGPSPEAVMAQEESPAFDSAPAQENMLVTLTAYEY